VQNMKNIFVRAYYRKGVLFLTPTMCNYNTIGRRAVAPTVDRSTRTNDRNVVSTVEYTVELFTLIFGAGDHTEHIRA
jgi:hypothetical protein